MYQVECAALKYYNSVVSEECLYIGILFHNLTTGQHDFRYISNFKRFQSFDDEADLDFVKLYLKGIQNEVKTNIFNYNEFSVKEYIRRYANEFRFTDVIKIEVDESENYEEDLTKLYLRFDFIRQNRLTNDDEKKYIKRILQSKYRNFSSPAVRGEFHEEITFDYIVNNIGIKLFKFQGKTLSRMIHSAKHWAFTARELKDRMKIVFIYDDIESDSEELKIILKILKTDAEVFQIQSGIDYILSLTSQA